VRVNVRQHLPTNHTHTHTHRRNSYGLLSIHVIIKDTFVIHTKTNVRLSQIQVKL